MLRSTVAASRIGVTAQCLRDGLRQDPPSWPGLIAGTGYFIRRAFVEYVEQRLREPGIRVDRLEELAAQYDAQDRQTAAAPPPLAEAAAS
jgi:hypothetical protein